MDSTIRTTRIALLADLHYGDRAPIPQRRGEIASILLSRAVSRLNRLVRPDVTVVLGDLLDAGDAPDARDRRAELRAALDKLESPCIVIPGNHDGDASAFYEQFERPDETVDLAGARFLIFLDKEEPGYNASRSRADIDRLRHARAGGFDGPVVALQHVSLGPPAQLDTHFNYTNVDEIIAAMREGGVKLSLSAHSHVSRDVTTDHARFIVAPALCESPFAFSIITITGEDVKCEEHQLALPEGSNLMDWHVHTPFAYCSEDMNIELAIRLAQEFNLAGMGFAEHSGQLYFSGDRYWGGQCLQRGLEAAIEEDNRMRDYLATARPYRSERVRVGLELDCDFQGRLIVTPEDRAQADYVLGSIHGMATMKKPEPSPDDVRAEFLFLVESMLKQGITILAHPFRILRPMGHEFSSEIFEPTVNLLRKYNTAAEMNFHHKEHYPEFLRMCVEQGVKIALGADAHNLCDVGDLEGHLRMLKEIGASDRLDDVLLR